MTTISISPGSCDAAYGAIHEGHKVVLHLGGREYPLSIKNDPAQLCHSNDSSSPVPIRTRALCTETDNASSYFDFIDVSTVKIAQYKAAWKGALDHTWQLEPDVKEALIQRVTVLRRFCTENHIPHLIVADFAGDGEGDNTAIVAMGNMPSAGRASERIHWLKKIASQPGATMILAEAVATGRIDLDEYTDRNNQSADQKQ